MGELSPVKACEMKMENNRMTAGTGEDSYACNSLIQAISITKIIPVVKDALEGLYSNMVPKCVMVGELGCASGPNTLLLLPEIIDITYRKYREFKDKKIPEIKVFLNDLPGNDFNTISMSLPEFYEKLEVERDGDIGHCFISATPGSYYKRLFPSTSIHFVHSSNSVHWLSQVPKKLLDNEGKSMNKGNIYIAESSSPEIHAAYREQFQENFTTFLKFRAQEIVPNGCMVLNLMESTKLHGPQHLFMKNAVFKALKAMSQEGLIEEEKIDDFEIPFYPPTTEELHKLIEEEGSFQVKKHEHYTLNWDLPTKDQLSNNIVDRLNVNNNEEIDLYVRAKFAAGPIRSGLEYMLATHFGKELMEDLFSRVILVLAQELSCGKLETFHHAICLVKT